MPTVAHYQFLCHVVYPRARKVYPFSRLLEESVKVERIVLGRSDHLFRPSGVGELVACGPRPS